MPRLARQLPPHRAPAPRALVAVLLATLALGGSTTASGAALKSGAGREREAALKDHHLHCKCATRCRGTSCCCGPDRPTDQSPVHAHSESLSLASALAPETDVDLAPGPCMLAAPCDGAVPTNPAPHIRIVDTAALLYGFSPPPTLTGARLIPFRSDRLPEVALSRLEEPPERS